MSHAPLYIVELSGSSRAPGVQHGRLLRAPIEHALDVYRDFFRTHLGLTPDEMRRRAARYAGPTARASARLMAEYEGIAEGSGQTLEDILALSAPTRSRSSWCRSANARTSTSAPAAPSRAMLGQNWDWRPEVMNFRAVLVCRCDDQPDFVMVTECGQPGKCGRKAHGLGVAEAGLTCAGQTSVGRDLFVVTLRTMLEQTDFDAARAMTARVPPEATCCPPPTRATPWTSRRRRTACSSSRSLPTRCRDKPGAHPPVGGADCGAGSRGARDRGALARRHREQRACDLHEPGPAQAGATTWLQTLCSMVMDLNAHTLWVNEELASVVPYQRVTLAGIATTPSPT